MAQPRNVFRSSFVHDYFPPGLKWLLISNTAVFLLYYLGGRTIARHMTVLFALYGRRRAAQPVRLAVVHATCSCTAASGTCCSTCSRCGSSELNWSATGAPASSSSITSYCGIAAGVCVLAINIAVGRLAHPHHRRLGRHFRHAGGVRSPLSQPDRADELPVSHQGQVPGDDLRRHRAADDVRTQQRRQHHRPPGRHGVRVRLPQRPVAARSACPTSAGAYRQWKLARAKKKFQVYMRKHGNGPWVN